jgi:Glycosyl transferase family group 2
MTVLRCGIIIAWFSSSLWLAMALLAFVIHLVRHHHHGAAASTELKKIIIQITTIGDDIIVDTVGQLRTALNGRDKSLFEIWVVTEPSDPRSYPFVDEVLVVPPDFQTSQHTKFKSRALEYARLHRLQSGLTGYKVLYIDDDSTLSPEFVDDCYNRSFDLLQGVVIISRPHGILPNLDASLRAMSCITICTLFQELNHHIWTHGEGFCIDEEVDRAVSWNHPGWYADDLVYGALATRKMGFRMDSTYARVQTNPPTSIRQYIKQRRRWFWAFVNSCYLLPVSTQLELWGFAIMGLVITPVAVTGIILADLGLFHLPAQLALVSRVLFVVWILAWGFSGYFSQRRVRGIVVGVISAAIAPTVGFFISLAGILMGPVQTFEVMRRVEGPWVAAVSSPVDLSSPADQTAEPARKEVW